MFPLPRLLLLLPLRVAVQCLCSAGFGHDCAVLVPGFLQGKPFISDLPMCCGRRKHAGKYAYKGV